MKYSFGDVVLVDFPFSDRPAEKRRPGLVINHDSHGDILVSRITSKHPDRITDIPITCWREAGLNIPSTIRVLKLAMTNDSYVLRHLGRLSEHDSIAAITAPLDFVQSLRK